MWVGRHFGIWPVGAITTSEKASLKDCILSTWWMTDSAVFKGHLKHQPVLTYSHKYCKNITYHFQKQCLFHCSEWQQFTVFFFADNSTNCAKALEAMSQTQPSLSPLLWVLSWDPNGSNSTSLWGHSASTQHSNALVHFWAKGQWSSLDPSTQCETPPA